MRILPTRLPTFGTAALLLALVLSLTLPAPVLAGRVILLIPSRPSVEENLVPVQGQLPPDKAQHGTAKKEPAAKKDPATARKEQPAAKKETAPAKMEQPPAKREAPAEQDRKNDGEAEEPKPAGDPAPAPAPGERPGLAEITDQVNASIMAGVAPRHIREEVDLLMAGMEPFRMHGYSMDPPRLFSIYRFDRSQDHPDQPAGSDDRLGDILEIR